MDAATQVLDVGSGYATYLSDTDVTALDISAAALKNSPRARTVVGSADALPFDDRSFDVVVCSQVLEHVPDWSTAISEMVRVLRPGGLLFLAVPNRYALMKRRYHELERLIDHSGHIHEFREAQLVFALLERGLERIGSQGACYDLFWLGARLERSRLARFAVPIMDRLPPRVLGHALARESRRRRHRLNGLSLELWGFLP
jgi:SAM-dependent methyltransferase